MSLTSAFTVGAALAIAGIATAPATALAAAPPNDAYADRARLELGTPVTVDTTEATVEDADLEATAISCGGRPPATTNTVWYDWDAGAAPPPQVLVTASGAAPLTAIAVVTGDPGSFTSVTCGLSALFHPQAGTVYHLLVFDPLGSGGGVVTVTIAEAPPAPTLSLSIAPTGRFDQQSGAALVSGTYTCTDSVFAVFFGEARQQVGRVTISGMLDTTLASCDGEPHPWSATVQPHNGKFAGGKMLVGGVAFACGPVECTQIRVEQTVALKGRA